MKRHVLSLLVENHSGALSRVSGLFSSRGYNITSLSVAETEDPSVSQMTIVVYGEESILGQIFKQLDRLIDIINVTDYIDEPLIVREVVLVKVDNSTETRREVLELCSIFGARVLSTVPSNLVLELTGATESINDFIQMIKPYGIRGLVRSGATAISRSRD
ncbi:MAG: acetolactate synthase small subunit [Chitinispirillaceae bacterium]|nr:acetolactate synthase small subunit [Chitinispirillaceae bacterium]